MQKKSTLQKYFYGFIGCFIFLILYFLLLRIIKADVLGYGVYDSYTLQALAWRNGHVFLPENYSWLEIAEYQGRFFLSFPPIPSIPMLFLTFIFGEQPPSLLIMIVYSLASYFLAYTIAIRLGNTDLQSATWAFFLITGSSYLCISMYGWVWYMAQALSLTLSLATILCLLSDKRLTQGIGLIAFALAVGCRPFQAIYLPILLVIVWIKNKQESWDKTLTRIIPMLIIPACIAICYGLYNYVRFDNPFEFGHNYLPEFRNEDVQFSLKYIPEHLKVLFTEFPFWENGYLSFPLFNGFAFYIANPIFIIFLIRFIRKPKRQALDWTLLVFLILQFFFTLCHKTLGGWQFGTRYLIDLLPTIFFLCVRYKQKWTWYEIAIAIFGIALNIYGSLWFFFISN